MTRTRATRRPGRRACPRWAITVDVATVRADFETMELAEFRRAYLCQWPEVASPGWKLFTEDDWKAVTS